MAYYNDIFIVYAWSCDKCEIMSIMWNNKSSSKENVKIKIFRIWILIVYEGLSVFSNKNIKKVMIYFDNVEIALKQTSSFW